MASDTDNLKGKVARTIKWNLVDRVAQQVLYAVTGVVLARMLTQEEFGLVGALVVFQAFAMMMVDSGFSSALIQRKSPHHLDYTTVFWFNMGVATGLYAILWFTLPVIAGIFGGDPRLVPLGRVLFASLPLNAAGIVQANLLMKAMNVKPITVANSFGLVGGAVVGIWMAVRGYGAWAIVGQTLTVAAGKSVTLWFSARWIPGLAFSMRRLRSFFTVGSGVMVTSFLSTFFQNVCSFFIGNRAGLVSLGYFTQADKWSKMGVMSLSQTLTSSFLPALSQVQDDPERFSRHTRKMNRLTAYAAFPAMGLLAVVAEPVFHALFGLKWDYAIPLFQILCLRGIFTILTLVYAHYILALGRTRLMVWSESVRNILSLVAILVTLPVISNLQIFLWGQFIASAIAWGYTVRLAARVTGRTIMSFLDDLWLALVLAVLACACAALISVANPWAELSIRLLVGCGVYFVLSLVNPIQREGLKSLRGQQLH